MAYEYEELVISTVYDLNSEMYPDKEIEIIKSELKEVYAKAKAFDEILDIDLAQHDEEYADNVMKVVNKYMEDK